MPGSVRGTARYASYRATQTARLVAAVPARPQQCETSLRRHGAPSRTAADRERTCGVHGKRGDRAGVAVPTDAAEAQIAYARAATDE